MDSADCNEVFKRLAEKDVPFLDERHREMPLPEYLAEQPLFLQARN